MLYFARQKKFCWSKILLYVHFEVNEMAFVDRVGRDNICNQIVKYTIWRQWPLVVYSGFTTASSLGKVVGLNSKWNQEKSRFENKLRRFESLLT